MKKERLDKITAQALGISRTDASRMIRGSLVKVNGGTVASPSAKIDPESDSIETPQGKLTYERHVYIMLNKPAGVMSASRDAREKTVIDLLPAEIRRDSLFPAGRLDKDTTGLMLITDDGDFAHRILSPKRHVEKEYLLTVNEKIEDKFIKEIESGMTVGDDTLLPAKIGFIGEEDGAFVYSVVLHEGRYHQIKRMTAKTNATLLSLKRIRMGALLLDGELSPGEAKKLTAGQVRLVTGEDAD